MKKSGLARIIATAAAVMSFASVSARAVVIYDNVTNAENNTGATDNGNDFTVLGTQYNATGRTKTSDNAGGGLFAVAAGTTDITGFDLFPTVFVTNNSGGLLTGAANNYSGLKITGYVWGGVNLGTVNASSPAYNNLLGSFTITDFEGTGAFANGNIYNYENGISPGVIPGITLSTPIVIPSTVALDTAGEPVLGISYVITATQGTNGSTATYAAVDGVGASYTYGSPATVGDMSTPGTGTFNTAFYFNSKNEQNGNFTAGPYEFTGLDDSSLALRAYGDVAVPEPTTLSLAAIAAVGLLGRRASRRNSMG